MIIDDEKIPHAFSIGKGPQLNRFSTPLKIYADHSEVIAQKASQMILDFLDINDNSIGT